MAGRYQRPSTPAERDRRERAHTEKLAALHDRLAEQVAALRSGPDWARWLDVAARFPAYSFNNTLLIAAQRPGATQVAGYAAWQALGRQVDKGEKGLQILAPIVRRSQRPDGKPDNDSLAPAARHPTASPGPSPTAAGQDPGEARGEGPRRVAGFRVAYVWDVSQTSGQPLPTPPRPQLLAGQAPEGLWDALTGLLTDRGYTVERGDCSAASPTANGYTDFPTRTVRVRGDVDDAQAVKTLAHELGHVLLHDPAELGPTAGGGSATGHCRGVVEVEAESVAYLVTGVHGLDTAGYTFPYVTSWVGQVPGADTRAQPERVVRDTAARVLGAAAVVLEATRPADPVDPALAARAQAGTEHAAAAREHADATLALARTPAPDPTDKIDAAAAAAQLDALARLHADAAAFYTAQLHAGSGPAARARALLAERGVPAAAAAGYELGYAPPGWTALVDHLRGRGWTDPQLLAAGVGMTTGRGTVVDRFRDRVMFPVREPSGQRIAGFLGRALTDTDGVPKYLNSPDTAAYRKGDLLYGLGAAPGRDALARGARPVLVEGPLDAIAVTAAGAGGYLGAAPCGTALTPGQITALDAHTGPLRGATVATAFDADPAGRAGALRAYTLLRAAGAWPTTAPLPDGHDPASLAQTRGPAALLAALDAAPGTPLADLAVDERLARWAGRLGHAEGRVGAARDAAALIATLPPEHVASQVTRVAARTGLPAGEVTGLVVDAVTLHPDAGSDAQGRRTRRDRREDLDRGQTASGAPTPPRLARAGYPHPIAGSTQAARRPPGAGPTAAGLPAGPRRAGVTTAAGTRGH